MKVRSPINIHVKSQVDRSTHNENLGEGSNEPPLRIYDLQKGLRLEGLTSGGGVISKYLKHTSPNIFKAGYNLGVLLMFPKYNKTIPQC